MLRFYVGHPFGNGTPVELHTAPSLVRDNLKPLLVQPVPQKRKLFYQHGLADSIASEIPRQRDINQSQLSLLANVDFSQEYYTPINSKALKTGKNAAGGGIAPP